MTDDSQATPTTETPAPAETPDPTEPADVAAAVATDGASALFVADFSDSDAAWEAYEELKQVTDTNRLKIEGVLVLKRTDDGTIEVQRATDYSTRRGLAWGLVGGVVLGVLFPPSIIGSAAVFGAAGAGIGRLRHRHNSNELADELAQAIDPGHSGLVALVSDPSAVEVQEALAKANRIVQKAVDKAAADDIKAEAQAAEAQAAEPTDADQSKP